MTGRSESVFFSFLSGQSQLGTHLEHVLINPTSEITSWNMKQLLTGQPFGGLDGADWYPVHPILSRGGHVIIPTIIQLVTSWAVLTSSPPFL